MTINAGSHLVNPE